MGEVIQMTSHNKQKEMDQRHFTCFMTAMLMQEQELAEHIKLRGIQGYTEDEVEEWEVLLRSAKPSLT